MANKIMAAIEAHPVMVSIAIGGIGLAVTLAFMNRNNSASQNTVTGVPTDAAGNPLTGGFSMTPPLSNSDVATMLQDMEQQILDWEKSFQPGTSGGNSGGNNGGGTPVGSGGNHCPPGQAWNPITQRCSGDANPGGIPTGLGHPPIPGSSGPGNNPQPVFAKSGVWPGPLSSIWSFYQQFGHGESWQQYENQFVQWNHISNPNVIQKNTSYRVW